MTQRPRIPGADLVLAILLTAILIPALVILPRLGTMPNDVVSAATAAHYNTGGAFNVVILWAALALIVGIFFGEARTLPSGSPTTESRAIGAQRGLAELLLVIAVVTAALWPPFLARSGPYIEDQIFINAAHRTLAGMAPYTDFEFLYGPLTLFPLIAWLKLTGFSMQSYFWFLLLLEIAVMGGLAVFLQRRIADWRHRTTAFALMALLLMNPLLGLNYNGLRKIIPLAALLLLSRGSGGVWGTAGAGAIMGLGLAYSHDSALTAAVASAPILLLEFGRSTVRRAFANGVAYYISAVVVWLAVTLALLGSHWPDYLRESSVIVKRFSAGEAGFEFYWTALTVALFALLALGLVVLGAALRKKDWKAWQWGDRFLLGALPLGLLWLRSGINRADVWHVGTAVLAVVVAMLIPIPRRTTRLTPTQLRVAMGLAWVTALATLIGNAPTLSYVAQGWVRGATHNAAAGRPSLLSLIPPAPFTLDEQADPNPDVVALAAFLAAPPYRDRPIFFYGALWGIGPRLGIVKRDPLNDDFLYSDDKGLAAGRWLARQPNPLVLIEQEAWERLNAPDSSGSYNDVARRWQPSRVKDLGSWLATVHYRGVPVEERLKDRRWFRTVGQGIKERFVPIQRFGSVVVLSQP